MSAEPPRGGSPSVRRGSRRNSTEIIAKAVEHGAEARGKGERAASATARRGGARQETFWGEQLERALGVDRGRCSHPEIHRVLRLPPFLARELCNVRHLDVVGDPD